MKKNIQINLFGTIYNIDDDAYRMLDNYLDSMRRYFARQDGGDEIADDIEHRVAELLWQKRQLGMEAVSIDVIREIIAQIGNPQDIGSGNAAASDPDSPDASEYSEYEEVPPADAQPRRGSILHNMRTRRLYRNAQDKMLGGVCSGLARYVGWGDSVVWRLLFVVLTFVVLPMMSYPIERFFHLPVSGFWLLPIFYLVLWLIVPEDHTPEDRLRMRGDEVTPENINQEIINDSQTTATPPTRPAGSGCLKVALLIVLAVCLMPFIAIMVMLLIGFFMALMAMLGNMGWSNAFSTMAIENMGLNSTYFSTHGWIIMTGIIAMLMVIIIPLYLIIRRLAGRHTGRRTLLTCAIIWMLMTAWSIVAAVAFAADVNHSFNNSITPPQPDTTAVAPWQPGPPQFDDELTDTAAIDVRSYDYDEEE